MMVKALSGACGNPSSHYSVGYEAKAVSYTHLDVYKRQTILLYEDEFELTFNLAGEEPQPEQAAQEPPVPPKPKAAAPVVDLSLIHIWR